MPVEDVYAFSQQLGFESDQISSALEYGQAKRLLDASPRYNSDAAFLSYRITTVGAYTARTLLGYFAYLDAVSVDTPIVDQTYSWLIQDAHTVSERLARAEYFRVYLDKQWAKMAGSTLPWEWPAASSRIADDVRHIGRTADPATWSQAPDAH